MGDREIKYEDFLDLEYAPSESDLICLFKITPSKDLPIEKVAIRVAAESSNGTWTTLNIPDHIKALSAKVYQINGNYVKIAYPNELFEEGNMPQILSSIAGNVFGMKALLGLRLLDVKWPKNILQSFKGPQFGINGIRKILKVDKRPITATVPKPKVGFYAEEHAQHGYEIWSGGVDLLKDDENLSNQKFNSFERRLELSMKMRDKAESETGERKSYLINITAEVDEMRNRASLVKDYGNEYVMVDILTIGWAAVQTLRKTCEDLGLAIHAHRAFHAAFDRSPDHGMSMKVLAEIARMQGVDQLHIGGLGKLAGDEKEVRDNYNKIASNSNEAGNEVLEQMWYGMKNVLSVCSGGVHPGIIHRLMDLLSTDIAVQVGGGVLGHPEGTKSGAMALRQAINAYMENIDVNQYAKNHPELKQALKLWGDETPI
ncbi:MAG: type III ribulose-bisphosphate carboxylase [Candidatus Hermodarchaeota archaeon]